MCWMATACLGWTFFLTMKLSMRNSTHLKLTGMREWIFISNKGLFHFTYHASKVREAATKLKNHLVWISTISIFRCQNSPFRFRTTVELLTNYPITGEVAVVFILVSSEDSSRSSFVKGESQKSYAEFPGIQNLPGLTKTARNYWDFQPIVVAWEIMPADSRRIAVLLFLANGFFDVHGFLS